MASNFDFLSPLFPVLAKFGAQAEQYCYPDPNTCLMKLGMIEETIVKLMFQYDRLALPYENTAVKRIDTLQDEGLLSQDLVDILHALRKNRNKAIHENWGPVTVCIATLPMAYSLCEWFMMTYGDYSYQPRPYVLPAEQTETVVVDKAEDAKEEEKLIESAEKVAQSSQAVPKAERKQRSQRAASQRKISEAETRYLIDEQLRQVGWEADTQVLRYSNGTRPEKGRNLAIAEWPTDSRIGNYGRVDYALFVGLELVAMVEAKAEHVDIPAVMDVQGKDYPSHVRAEDAEYQIGTWGEYKVPFMFATNGRPYLEQWREKSGIWFRDNRNPANIPYALRGWFSPDGLMERLEKDVQAGNQKLESESYDLLTDPDGLNLRYYQVNAIKKAEEAIVSGQTSVLLAMATGTGKTRTILGMIYRFLKTDRFKRILFLVDRTSLGDQADEVFKDVTLENLMSLDQIYNIKGLDDKLIDKETRIQIATVQGMVKRILYNDGEAKPAVSDFDLIIVDEAHRGYTLDRELGDTELLYRDQRDFQSKYRSVIEYFDAVKIALTATPALHTTQIFGSPVFKYTYREAVIDGYLVDHDAPHQVLTKLRNEGIRYERGDTITLYDPVTHEIINSELLEDELDFDVSQFNRKVTTRPFNETVLNRIAKDLDPDNPEEQGKTLIFAVDDNHADMIVSILRDYYKDYGLSSDAIQKITGSVGGGNPKKVRDAIKHFKNEQFPSIVVTVDLLTTGIDVPEITTLVFMRRVNSRILFEQMLGRATRLCPKIHKTHFEIYDPVGVYEALEPVSTMKPVVTSVNTTFTQLLDGLEELEDADHVQNQINQLLAKLQRVKRKLNPKTLEHFSSMTGGKTPDQFIADVHQKPAEEGRENLLSHRPALELLDERVPGRKRIVISDMEDELLEVTRGYGKENISRPEDYLEAFSRYIKNNVDEIAALNIVCTRPKELTRDSLRSLALTLDREGFTQQQLNTAVSQVTNEEITADIITLIRRYAIGSALMSHSERIRQAVTKLKKAHDFSRQELSWLGRMEKYLMEESVLNVRVFDEDSRFRNKGGFRAIDRIFGGTLESVVQELNEYLYDDGGHSA